MLLGLFLTLAVALLSSFFFEKWVSVCCCFCDVASARDKKLASASFCLIFFAVIVGNGSVFLVET